MAKGEGLFSRVLSTFSLKKGKEEKSYTCPVKLVTDYEILVSQGDEPGKKYVLPEHPCTIGRLLADDNRQGYILIKDKTMTVSSNQADITWDKRKKCHSVKPRKTTNPTCVNGKAIKKIHFLSPGDIIEIGKVVLKYQKVSKEHSEVIVGEYDQTRAIDDKRGPSPHKPSSLVPALSSTETLLPDESHIYLLDRESTVVGEDVLLEEDEDDVTIDGKDMASKREGFEFIVEEGNDTGRVFNVSRDDIEKTLTIGYKGSGKSDIDLDDSNLDDIQASLRYREGSIMITLESPHKDLLVNGFSVKEKVLEDNDLVRLAATLLRFRVLHREEDVYELEILEGEGQGSVYPLGKAEFRMGRKSKSASSFLKDIEFPSSDRTISRRHATIVRKDGDFCIINESKKSITLVNGVQVAGSRQLKDGDKIKIGEHVLLLFRKLSLFGEDDDFTIAPPLLKRTPDRKPELSLDEDEAFQEKYSLSSVDEDIKQEFKSVPHAKVSGTAEISSLPEKEVKEELETLVEFDIKPSEEERPVSSDEYLPEEEEDLSLYGEKVTEEKPFISKALAEEDMVFIEEGKFCLGSDEETDSDCYPMHEVYTRAFYMDRYPVTNSKYRDFVEATGYKSQGGWESSFLVELENHPVSNITCNDAMEYAKWAGKRLPTEVEWEKAARGNDKRKYPWGNIWEELNLNSKNYNMKGTTPVDRFPQGKSPFGVMDMMGNTWEWTASLYAPYPNTEGVMKKGTGRVVRGGSWVNFLRFSGVTIRFEAFPDEFGPDIGFRCVRDVEE